MAPLVDNENPNIVRVSRHGNDATYLAARIQRDYPDIAERLDAGEFPSVRAAALEAGIEQNTEGTVNPCWGERGTAQAFTL